MTVTNITFLNKNPARHFSFNNMMNNIADYVADQMYIVESTY